MALDLDYLTGEDIAQLPVTDIRHVLGVIRADKKYRERMEFCRKIKNEKNRYYWLKKKQALPSSDG